MPLYFIVVLKIILSLGLLLFSSKLHKLSFCFYSPPHKIEMNYAHWIYIIICQIHRFVILMDAYCHFILLYFLQNVHKDECFVNNNYLWCWQKITIRVTHVYWDVFYRNCLSVYFTFTNPICTNNTDMQ